GMVFMNIFRRDGSQHSGTRRVGKGHGMTRRFGPRDCPILAGPFQTRNRIFAADLRAFWPN
ncbi:MAG: hypothetical protein ACK53L_30605, partial [Pirellulaceae bacterium]